MGCNKCRFSQRKGGRKGFVLLIGLLNFWIKYFHLSENCIKIMRIRLEERNEAKREEEVKEVFECMKNKWD